MAQVVWWVWRKWGGETDGYICQGEGLPKGHRQEPIVTEPESGVALKPKSGAP